MLNPLTNTCAELCLCTFQKQWFFIHYGWTVLFTVQSQFRFSLCYLKGIVLEFVMAHFNTSGYQKTSLKDLRNKIKEK